jgi:hypothetical protein
LNLAILSLKATISRFVAKPLSLISARMNLNRARNDFIGALKGFIGARINPFGALKGFVGALMKSNGALKRLNIGAIRR